MSEISTLLRPGVDSAPMDDVAERANERTEFLGLLFDSWSPDRASGWLEKRNADSPYAYLVTPNVDHMVRLADAPVVVRRAYEDADVKLCDSRILARLARFVGVKLSVVPGSDLTATLFRKILRTGDRLCLIGGNEGDGARLEKLYPGIRVVQHRPPMGLRTDASARAAAVDAAVDANARVTLFAVGSPQQELLARDMADRQAHGTGLCVGASTDFLLGTQNRAPSIVQRSGFEWAWRLLTNPRRLAHRYLVDGPAIFPMTWRWYNRRQVMAADWATNARIPAPVLP